MNNNSTRNSYPYKVIGNETQCFAYKVDRIQLTYTGNQLTRVSDNMGNSLLNASNDFRDYYTGTTAEFWRFRRYPPTDFGDTRSLFCCLTILTG